MCPYWVRVMASVVRPAGEPEAKDPFAQMTFEELRAELLAGFASLFSELRVVAGQGRDERPVKRSRDEFIRIWQRLCLGSFSN